MPPNGTYEAVIGLEVHAQLLTDSKAFCNCSTRFGDPPNSNVCPVCLGMPGVLPVLNAKVVEFVVRMGLATNCTIAQRSVFARKNYFYPDLPKGYQISQYEEPICTNGYIVIDTEPSGQRAIGITRIHMEEDAGKSIHDQGSGTLVDANRCGVPLIEIVSEPDLHTPSEAYQYLSEIKRIVTYLGICNGNMEEGSLRCDANVSVRRRGTHEFGTKTELKNLNSFRFVEKALAYEIDRQTQIVQRGEQVVQETLLWDADQGAIVPMRSKEEAHDYRYFPEPDLAPVVVSEEVRKEIRKALPELPRARRDRLVGMYGLPKYDADILTEERSLAEYFEAVVIALARKDAVAYKQASNWVMTEVLRVLNESRRAIAEFPIEARRLAEMIDLVVDGTISGRIAKTVFEEMLISTESAKSIVQKKGWSQVSDTAALENVVDDVLTTYKEQVEQYKSGKQQVFGFLVGETMKATKGKGNPKVVNEILRKKLEG